jgi:hypothetical protein
MDEFTKHAIATIQKMEEFTEKVPRIEEMEHFTKYKSDRGGFEKSNFSSSSLTIQSLATKLKVQHFRILILIILSNRIDFSGLFSPYLRQKWELKDESKSESEFWQSLSITIYAFMMERFHRIG